MPNFNPREQEKMSDEKTRQHGGNGWYWDNLAAQGTGGWRMECLCGFMTTPDIALSVCGEEMDEHLYEVSKR